MELTDEPLILRSPKSPDEWDAYFDLRWRFLRQPGHQPRGSERDSVDVRAKHWHADGCISMPGTKPK